MRKKSNTILWWDTVSLTRKRLTFAIVFACLLSISGVFSNAGLWQAYRLRKATQTLEAGIEKLTEEKARLSSLIKVSQASLIVQEITVRDAIGFVRDGETVFEFTD